MADRNDRYLIIAGRLFNNPVILVNMKNIHILQIQNLYDPNVDMEVADKLDAPLSPEEILLSNKSMQSQITICLLSKCSFIFRLDILPLLFFLIFPLEGQKYTTP